MGRWNQFEKTEIVTTRSCLKCGIEFESRGRFNRLCPSCGRANSKTPADEPKSWMSIPMTRTKQRGGKP